MQGLLLHFFGSCLGITAANSISVVRSALLVVGLEFLGEVFKILSLDLRIEVLGLKHNYILLILVHWDSQFIIVLIIALLLASNAMHRHQFWIIAILQNLETKVVLVLQVVEQHLGKVHRLLQCLGIWKRTRIKKNLDVLLLDIVPGDECLLWRLLRKPDLLVDG